MLTPETPVTFQKAVIIDDQPVVREFHGVLVKVHEKEYEIAHDGTTVMIPMWRVRARAA